MAWTRVLIESWKISALIVCTACMSLCHVSYNPMSAGGERMHDILHEFKFAAIITLQGTARRTWNEQAVDIFRMSGYHVIDFGWKKHVKHSNRSCGCTIMLKVNIFPTLHTIYAPTENIAGRAGAVRITRGDMDMLVITFYFPPDYGSMASRATVSAVIEWVSSIVLKMPADVL